MDKPLGGEKRYRVIELFAGPGGWDEAAVALGLQVIGIEHDESACRTRVAAGHLTIRADVASYPIEPFIGKVSGLIASPPCQAFSAAGGGKGRDITPDLVRAVFTEDWTARPDPDPKVWLVLEPGRWIDVLRPEWVAMEQVPGVLPIWQAYVQVLRRWGYQAHTQVLNTADFGVPQTRERAILLASKGTLRWPEPTHAEHPVDALFGAVQQPWVSWGEALGTPDTWEMEYQRGAGLVERHGERPRRPATEPSFTVRAGTSGSGANFVIHPEEAPV